MIRIYEHETFSRLNLNEICFENCKFTECVFESCVFEKLDFVDCVFLDCKFISCRISNPLAKNSKMSNSEFYECYLLGVNWSHWIVDSRLYEPFSILNNCRIRYCCFNRMGLVKFDFCGCEITESSFSECKLSKSSFKECMMNKTDFFKCDLTRADFRDAVGYKIDTKTNQLREARFSFPEVVNLLSDLGIKIE